MRESEREREPWGPEEGPLEKPQPHSWFELTSVLLDRLACSLQKRQQLEYSFVTYE